MEPIRTDEPDGREPLPICRAQRQWLVDRYTIAVAIAHRFLADDIPVLEGDQATDARAVEHLRTCPKCRAWITAVVPEDVMVRQQRMTRYCCAGMFVAVEESAQHDVVRFAFELFRGEDPCWMIAGTRAFASYCPWCGTKLPKGRFVEDDAVN